MRNVLHNGREVAQRGHLRVKLHLRGDAVVHVLAQRQQQGGQAGATFRHDFAYQQVNRLADSNPMHLVDVAVYFPDAGPLKQTRPTEARSVKSKHNPVHANCQSAESILPLGLAHC